MPELYVLNFKCVMVKYFERVVLLMKGIDTICFVLAGEREALLCVLCKTTAVQVNRF